ncbi:MAG: hypothetical protein ACRCUY_07350 [Thermoguttaceae bacterium]
MNGFIRIIIFFPGQLLLLVLMAKLSHTTVCEKEVKFPVYAFFHVQLIGEKNLIQSVRRVTAEYQNASESDFNE